MVTTKSILDEPIKEINVPVMKPSRSVTKAVASLKSLAKKSVASVKKTINKFANWILSLPNEPIKRGINEREAPMRGFLKTYRINGEKGQDQETYINRIKPKVINFLSGRRKPFQVKFIFTCRFQKGVSDEEMEYNYGYFHTNIERIMEETDLGKIYDIMTAMCLEKISQFQNKGSGWQFEEVESFDMHVDPFKPLGGSSYFPLPKKLAAKKAIINVKNEKGNECFKWAVTSAVYPREKNGERLNGEMRSNSERIDWTGIDFPTPLKQIKRFEKLNPYPINVYGWRGGNVYPLRISEHENGRDIDLLLLTNGKNNHYCWIKKMSALVTSQINKHEKKRYFCKYCCNSFPTEKSLQKHLEYCLKRKAVRVEMPEKGTMLSFKNYHKKMRVPFVVYADFEAFTESISTCSPNDASSYTKQYQRHKPCSFSFYIKCFDDELFQPELKWYTTEGRDENIGKIFVENLESDIVKIYQRCKFKKNMRITRKEEGDFKRALNIICHICENLLHDDKVRDHCHLTGRYRGAAHNQCNLNYRIPKFYPVIFHNISGYDTHMFIKDLAETEGEINCIAKTEEDYISFTKTIIADVFKKGGEEIKVKRNIRFLDSFRFMPSSLAELASNLTQHCNLSMFFRGRELELVKKKGVYPYDYMDSFKRLSETSLPSIDHLYSKLNDTSISMDDYTHAQRVWGEFGMNSMRDYHDLYQKTDVLLLADVFEEFRKVCLDNYQLDPAWYYTSPGLAWDACQRMTRVELELLHDQDMLLMVEEGIRGGVSMISTRYGKANNKYMQEYDPSLPSKHIIYLDANNLYGWAMSRKLPTHGFKWMSKDSLAHWENMSCILEVDLEYPHDLHDLHNDYPLAPERLEVNGVTKLIPNFYDKKKYVMHYEALKLYVNYGLKITKIHRGITFKESAWLKDYIDMNTRLRTNSKNNFESNFFKLMNNSVFGKTIENIRKRTNIKLATTEK